MNRWFLFMLSAVFVVASIASFTYAIEEELLFRDAFDREDSDDVGHGWKTTGTAVLERRAALFRVNEEEFRPRMRHTFPPQREGKFTVTFRLDWLRESEGNWIFYMQLGNSEALPRLLVYDRDLAKGIAVNLAWGGGEFVGAQASGSFGYFENGEFQSLFVANDLKNEASVVEDPVVSIDVDMDSQTYRLSFNGETYSELPFDDSGPIDTIRFITNGCSQSGFTKSSIDDVTISKRH